ncbi:AAA family ATPase [Mycobacteroides abscessus]|uniref:AAA family ATPase n=1 Tax=Mycobacteroides abscessus TaxID=36809 RepID=UPI0010C9F2EC|nr:AAA family ATPase [Mycobacteroides abscessus]TKV35328.1 ATPase [Mycobacteroides abscessus subsp. bolletii]
MPLLHVLAGPNGSGKTTYVERVLQPCTQLPFINADVIAAQRWPNAQEQHAYAASRAAAAERVALLDKRRSFITETVFSHPSKNTLIDNALHLGYTVHLHVILVPVDLTVQRVSERVRRGGHSVPEQKIRERYARLWPLIAQARGRVDRAEFFDNHLARHPYRLIATYVHGIPVGEPDWPKWTPGALL